MGSYADHKLPDAIEVEQLVLGTLLVTPQLFAEAGDLREEDFFLESHKRIWRHMRQLFAEGMSVDIFTVTNSLKETGELDAIGGGGISYVSKLTDGTPQRGSLHFQLEILREKAKSRQLVMSLVTSLDKLTKAGEVNSVISEIERDILDIMQLGSRKSERTMLEVVTQVRRDIERALLAKHGEFLGYTTGIESLDQITSGLRATETTILTGRTGQGKTAFATQICRANEVNRHKVKLYEIEMRSEPVVLRMVSQRTGIPHSLLRDPRFMNQDQKFVVDQMLDEIAHSPYFSIDDRPHAHVNELIARMRGDILRGVELIVVDYLQLVNMPEIREAMQRLSLVSGAFRDLAKHSPAHLIMLAQLKRPENENDNRRPTLYGLKESGDIENDAFNVIAAYRPKDLVTGLFTGKDEMIVLKQRNGIVGTVKVRFYDDTLSFKTDNWMGYDSEEFEQHRGGKGDRNGKYA